MKRGLKVATGFILLTALNAYGHPDITLKDQFGNPVVESKLPADARQSCGGCHDVDFIATGYHFQQGRLAILTAEVYKKYYERYGDKEFKYGLPERLTKLDKGMYGKL